VIAFESKPWGVEEEDPLLLEDFEKPCSPGESSMPGSKCNEFLIRWWGIEEGTLYGGGARARDGFISSRTLRHPQTISVA
jgi:hypothetical protein